MRSHRSAEKVGRGCLFDARRLEVVAEGLILFGGCQLALDSTVVSPLHGDGTHRRRSHVEDGAALREARKLKKEHVQNFARATEDPDSWSSQEKLEEGGQKRRRPSCGAWHAQRPRRHHDGCSAVRERGGAGGGRVSSLARRRKQWLVPSLGRRALLGREARCPQSTTWWLTPDAFCSAGLYSFGLA